MTDSVSNCRVPWRGPNTPTFTQAMLAQVDLIRDKKFNFAGCSASDLVSHYMLPSTMRCVYQVRPQSPERISKFMSLCLFGRVPGLEVSAVDDFIMASSRLSSWACIRSLINRVHRSEMLLLSSSSDGVCSRRTAKTAAQTPRLPRMKRPSWLTGRRWCRMHGSGGDRGGRRQDGRAAQRLQRSFRSRARSTPQTQSAGLRRRI